MDQKMKDTFCRQIDVELERISKLASLDNTSLNQLHMLTDTKKNLLKIEKLENDIDGYSMRGHMGGNSYDYIRGEWGNSNRMMPPGPVYGGSYDMGYSRNDTYSHLEHAMRDAKNDQEREEIRQLMMRYHN